MILPYVGGLEMKRPDTPKMKDWQVKAMARTIQKKIKDIEATFKEIDTDGSGKISHAEFIQALRKIGLNKVGDAESFQVRVGAPPGAAPRRCPPAHPPACPP